MKPKTISNVKIVLTLIAVVLVFVGGIGFMLSFAYSSGRGNGEKYYEQYPLNEKNGIAVDSKGNMFIGDGETGSIQVYDSDGNFKFGFSFPTGGAGWFAFGIKEDKIHLVTARTDSYFVFDDGELVSSEEGIGYDRSKELQAQYEMTEDNWFVLGDKVYKISPFNNVTIQDRLSGQVERIHLIVPIWPLPGAVYWGMAASGMLLLYVLHHKIFR